MSETVTPYNYIDNTGVIVPDTESLQAEVQSEFVGVFGAGMNTDASTPQGLLITAETLARTGVVQNNAQVANQINPNLSEGIFLDAIAALTGLERAPETYTTVSGVVLAGVQGSPIAANVIAKTTAGDQFALSQSVTLDPVTGQAVGTFVAVQPGPVPCGTGLAGINAIVTQVLGWETVSCPNAGVVGSATQSDEQFRLLRRNTLALQGVALIEAILSAVNNLPGVIGTQGLENVTSNVEVIQGVTMAAHSIWICVDGGVQSQIAQVLLANKSMGCAWNGAQSVTIKETISGQMYGVAYDIPTPAPLLVQVTCKQARYVGDPVAGVTQAVLDFSNNVIAGLQGFSVGQSASPFEIATAVMNECPGLYVSNVQIAFVGNVLQPAQIPLFIYQKATVTESNISVVVVT